MKEFEKGPPLYFKASGRLTRILGRESISNPMIALIETIKNSYDADATQVTIKFERMNSSNAKIVIKDNGTGMNFDDFDHIWMTAATDTKEKNPLSKKYKRQKIGEKGIGRFGIDNLARYLEINLLPEGESKGFRIIVDWEEFLKEDALFEKTPINSEFFTKNKSEHGFEIILSGLRRNWTTEDILNFRKEAEMIVPPTSDVENFSVKVICDDIPEINEIKLKNPILKQSLYTFTAELNKEGMLTYWLTVDGKKKQYGPSRPARKYSCGPSRLKFYFFYRDKNKYKKLLFDIDEIKKFLDTWGGIKLYRDNFRVKPYGDIGNDWLDLDDTRVQQPSLFPGNDQVFGFMKITKKYNPQLIDTTTREGLIENDAFIDLKYFVKDAVYFFAYARRTIEGKRKGRKVEEKPEREKVKIPKKLIAKEELHVSRELIFDFEQNRIPEEIMESLVTDIDEMKACFSIGSHRAVLMFCGLILETILARKYYEKEKIDPIQEKWNIGALIGKCKETGIIREDESEILDILNIVNKVRIKSVHKKPTIFMPTADETRNYVGLTSIALKKLLK